jgi:hypothetical protein
MKKRRVNEMKDKNKIRFPYEVICFNIHKHSDDNPEPEMVYVCSDPELEGSYRFECPECQNTILLFKRVNKESRITDNTEKVLGYRPTQISFKPKKKKKKLKKAYKTYLQFERDAFPESFKKRLKKKKEKDSDNRPTQILFKKKKEREV